MTETTPAAPDPRTVALNEIGKVLGWESAAIWHPDGEGTRNLAKAVAAVLAESARQRSRVAELTERLNKLHGVVATLGAVVVVADDTEEQIADEIIRAVRAAPPVLAPDTTVLLADDDRPWIVDNVEVKDQLGWWSAVVRLKPDLTEARKRRMAAGPVVDVAAPARVDGAEALMPLADVATPSKQRLRTFGGNVTWRVACWETYGEQIFDELVKAHAEIDRLRESRTADDGHLAQSIADLAARTALSYEQAKDALGLGDLVRERDAARVELTHRAATAEHMKLRADVAERELTEARREVERLHGEVQDAINHWAERLSRTDGLLVPVADVLDRLRALLANPEPDTEETAT